MVISTLAWAALGIASSVAITAIIVYWDEIVNWVKDLLDRVFKRGKLFLRWVNGELIPRVLGLINGKPYEEPGKRKIASEKDLYKMYEAGIITKPELEALLRGEEIYTDA